MLNGMPNSGRNVEAEVANRFIRDTMISTMDTPLDVTHIPTSLREFVIHVDGREYSYPTTFWVEQMLPDRPPEERFYAQMEIERGNVGHRLAIGTGLSTQEEHPHEQAISGRGDHLLWRFVW